MSNQLSHDQQRDQTHTQYSQQVSEALPEQPLTNHHLDELEDSDIVQGIIPEQVFGPIAGDRWIVAVFGIAFVDDTVAGFAWVPELESWHLLDIVRDPDDRDAAADRVEDTTKDWLEDRDYDQYEFDVLDSLCGDGS